MLRGLCCGMRFSSVLPELRVVPVAFRCILVVDSVKYSDAKVVGQWRLGCVEWLLDGQGDVNGSRCTVLVMEKC